MYHPNGGDGIHYEYLGTVDMKDEALVAFLRVVMTAQKL